MSEERESRTPEEYIQEAREVMDVLEDKKPSIRPTYQVVELRTEFNFPEWEDLSAGEVKP